jgi:Protein of unknown function (DUF4199)
MSQAVKTGLIAGVLILLFMVGEMYFPRESTLLIISQYGSRIVFFSSIYVAIKLTRDRELNGQLEFKNGLKAGLACTSITSIVIGALILYTTLNANTYDNIAEMKMNGVSKEGIIDNLRNFTYSNIIQRTFIFVCVNIVLGFFTSVAVTLMLRPRGTGF